MAEYQKIQTLYKRDARNIIIPSQYTLDEFNALKGIPWEATEKIDGTNIRIELNAGEDGKFSMEIKGRTDKAVIPTHLMERLNGLFSMVEWDEIFPDIEPSTPITLYGEGYGKKIQGVGGRYLKDSTDFILFDVKVGGWWLLKESVDNIAEKLGIRRVPFMGYMTLKEAEDFVRKGFKSAISEDRELDAEGLVLREPHGLRLRYGDRLIVKIKTADFVKFRNAYGDEENPVQPVNVKYNDRG